jgi:hypothetical protein
MTDTTANNASTNSFTDQVENLDLSEFHVQQADNPTVQPEESPTPVDDQNTGLDWIIKPDPVILGMAPTTSPDVAGYDDLPAGDKKIIDDLRAELDEDSVTPKAPTGQVWAGVDTKEGGYAYPPEFHFEPEDDTAIHSTDPDIADDYDASMLRIKSHPDFDSYRAGFKMCFALFMSAVKQLDDDDYIALMFDRVQTPEELTPEQQAMSDHAKGMLEFAEQEGWPDVQPATEQPVQVAVADDGSPVVREYNPDAPTELEQRMQALHGDQPMVSAASDTEPKPIEEMDVEKVLRELQADNERLQMASIRDTLAVQMWAHMADYFNNQLHGEPEDELNIPLNDKIEAYIDRLTHYDGELPPSLYGFIRNEPEGKRLDLHDTAKLALYIQRLQRMAGVMHPDDQ